MKKLNKTSNENNNKYDTISIVNVKYEFFDSFMHRNATGSIQNWHEIVSYATAWEGAKKKILRLSLFIYHALPNSTIIIIIIRINKQRGKRRANAGALTHTHTQHVIVQYEYK